MKSIAQCQAREFSICVEGDGMFSMTAQGKMPGFAVYIRFLLKLIW